ncbi:MAG: FG-GAP repeat domain-containing protein [Candidatus Binatia bacterium]
MQATITAAVALAWLCASEPAYARNDITFSSTTLPVSAGSTPGPQTIALADVGGPSGLEDGRDDILVLDTDNDQLAVYLNDGQGNFNSVPDSILPTDVTPVAIAVADFDRDGHLDVAIVNEDGQDVNIAFGNGTGSFVNNQTIISTPDPCPLGVVAVDLNDDNFPDLAVLSAPADGSNSTVLFIKNNGASRSFTSAASSIDTKSSGATAITAGFLNNSDNFVDLAISNGDEDNVSVLLGKGDGTFQVATLLNVGQQPVAIAVADLNGDGKSDLAVADGGEIADRNVSLVYGNGDGTFQGDIRTTAGLTPTAVATADFDGDGRIDLAITNVDEGLGVSVLRNDPENFGNPLQNNDNGFSLQDYSGLTDAVAVQTGDINGDGWPDMIALNANGDTIGIYLNTTGSTPTPTPTAVPKPTATPTRTRVPTPTPTLTVPPVTISIGSGAGLPGHSVDITVSLFSAGASIAATANDITFGTQVLSLDPSACRINPAIGKSLIVTVLDPGTGGSAATVRFFVTADRNVSPIPDGPLYTCGFRIDRAALPFLYALFNENTFAFSPTGMSVDPVFPTNGSVLVSLVATSATPTPPASHGGGGCSLSPEHSGPYPLTPAILVLALVCIARRARRRR